MGCDLDLVGRKGEPGYFGPEPFGDPVGIGPVAAADVDETSSGLNTEGSDGEFEQAPGCHPDR